MAQPVYSYTNGGTSTAVAIRSGPGILHTVVIGSSGTAGNNNIQIYDGTSSATSTTAGYIAQQIARIHTGTIRYARFDVVVTNGLFISNASSTADYTVTWA